LWNFKLNYLVSYIEFITLWKQNIWLKDFWGEKVVMPKIYYLVVNQKGKTWNLLENQRMTFKVKDVSIKFPSYGEGVFLSYPKVVGLGEFGMVMIRVGSDWVI
jgi:hypothetical protein